MTLRELMLSVDAEEYFGFPVFQELLKVKPEYGSNGRIEVNSVDFFVYLCQDLRNNRLWMPFNILL